MEFRSDIIHATLNITGLVIPTNQGIRMEITVTTGGLTS